MVSALLGSLVCCAAGLCEMIYKRGPFARSRTLLCGARLFRSRTAKKRRQMAMTTVERILRRAYGLEDPTHNKSAAWKYPTPKMASLKIRKLKKSLVYGEINPASWHRALRKLSMRKTDEFGDLGSGVAKVVQHTALASECKMSTGYEILRHQHDDAVCALSELGKMRPRVATRIKLIEGSFLDANLNHLTVVYVNNYLFEEPLFSDLFVKLSTLPRLRTVLCMKAPCPRHTAACHKLGRTCAHFHDKFELEFRTRCDVSWSKEATLLMYKLRA